MNTIRSSLFALAISAGLLTSASAQSYSVINIGVSYPEDAAALNGSGQVAGWVLSADRTNAEAFVTGPNGLNKTNIGTLGDGGSYATSINNRGQVAGFYDIGGNQRSFMLTAGGLIDIGTLNGQQTIAKGINDLGQITGWSYSAAGQPHAFLTAANGRFMKDIGSQFGAGASSYGSAINGQGMVVGRFTDLTSGNWHAFITGANGSGFTDLGALVNGNSEATAVNSSGQAAGVFDTPDGFAHAFLTGANGAGMTDIGTLGGLWSLATGINQSGAVVGISANEAGDRRAFLYTATGMLDLSTVAPLAANEYLDYAAAINESGQILARANMGSYYLLTPVPEPTSIALSICALGALGVFGRRKKTRQG